MSHVTSRAPFTDSETEMPAADRPAGDGDAPPDRAHLLERHLRLVHAIARRIHGGLGRALDLGDLVGAGTLGLIEAFDRFDPARGLAFSTFAVPRIRGAILDEVRRHDSVPSSLRRRTRTVTTAAARLANELGRRPRAGELAESLAVDLATVWRWQQDVERTTRVRLDAPRRCGEPGATLAAVLAAAPSDDVDERLTLARELELLRDAVLRLAQRERTVLILYYYEELRLREIAQVLGVTESRVAQIRTGALAKLRRELAPLRERVA
ncbi:MAG TPA: FliA/WhiG family RNA polymerase sigma factor [Gemmatimonadaceae bacterium]